MEIKDIVEIQKQEILDTSDLVSKIIVKYKDKLNIFGLMFKNNSEKDFMRKQVLNILNKMDIEQYWFASTAWFLSQNKDEKGKELYRRPSRDRNRKECLIVVEFKKDRQNKISFVEIKRKGTEIEFLKEDTSVGVMDSYWDLWENEKALDVKATKFIVENNQAFVKKTLKELMDEKMKLITDDTPEEEIEEMAIETMKEFVVKVKEQNQNLLEDVEKTEDDNA